MSGGLCSLDCCAKIIAWLQVIGHGIVTFVMLLLLVVLLATGFEPSSELVEARIQNSSNVELLKIQEEAAYHIELVVLIVLVLFSGALFALSFLLLVGLYKMKMNYVKYWLVAKGVLLFLAGLVIIFSMIGLLFGLDFDLTRKIVWFVINSVILWVIFVYWSEKKEDYIPA